jgi:hypothetical protein
VEVADSEVTKSLLRQCCGKEEDAKPTIRVDEVQASD